MYSSEDLERFYFQYQTEALPRGESMQSFCLKNKVPFNISSQWYKDTRKKIVEVQVDGHPSTAPTTLKDPRKELSSKNSSIRIWVELRMSNGMHISQKNLSYPELLRLVEKVEGLC